MTSYSDDAFPPEFLSPIDKALLRVAYLYLREHPLTLPSPRIGGED
jgi:hypothetical protein